MGWGRMLLLGNIGQQMDIEEQRAEISRLRRSLRSGRGGGGAKLEGKVAELEAEIDELRLYMAVLVRSVVAKGILSADEFRALVEAVDAEDGSADGRFSGPVA